VVALALGAGLLLAPHLFVSARSYPRAPVLDAWPLLPFPLDAVVLVGLLAALGGVALAPRPRWWAAAASGLMLILAADDQSRWQPWFFQYGLMIGGLALARDTEDALAAWRTVLIGLYFWSGVQKLNATFMTHLFPWLVEPLTSLLPGAMSRLVLGGWMVVPLTEIVVAVGFVVPPSPCWPCWGHSGTAPTPSSGRGTWRWRRSLSCSFGTKAGARLTLLSHVASGRRPAHSSSSGSCHS
jgi:hypothetical protein